MDPVTAEPWRFRLRLAASPRLAVAFLLTGAFVVLVGMPCSAKRTNPPKVSPIECAGIRYVAPNTDGRTGFVEAWDIRTGRKLWTATLFKNRINPGLEEDVQWVYIKTMKVTGDKLVATDERGRTHVVDLVKHAPGAPKTVSIVSVADQASAGPRLVYVKGGALWSVPLQANGQLARGARATKLPGLEKLKHDEGVELLASPDGRRLALTREADEASSVVLIDLTAAGRGLVEQLAGEEPAFSPDGLQIAYDGVADGKRGVVILTLATGETRLLRAGVQSPFWADDRIAVCGTDSEAPVLVLDAKTGKQMYYLGPAVNPLPPTLSPNGRYLAFDFHLSRPVVGDTLVDVTVPPSANGDVTPLNPPLPRGYAAQKVAAWSRDSREVLWAYLVTDPENDGDWLREDLWVAAPGSSKARLLARGRKDTRYTEARFTPDQKHVLWFQRRESHRGPGDIRWTPLAGGRSVTLVRGVRGFAVVP
jgi:hypothetical protein